MGILKGLKSITEHVDAEEAKFAKRGDSDSPATRWFKLADKQAVKVLFLQELDPDSKNYSEKNGLGFLAVEHSNPKNFKRKALCSADDGPCWACEQHAKDWKAGWKQKTRLYINVLVDDGVNDPFVAVLSQGNGPKSVTPSLIEQASEIGTITDKLFKIKRTGAGQTDTSYLLTPLGATDLNPEDYDVIDLETVVREVPYAQQEAHYLGGETSGSADEGAAPTPSVEASSDEW